MAKTIKLDHIAKIEGHANLSIKIDKGAIEKVNLEVFEGARFFEGILRGRRYDEVPILTSRICGICSCIHTTASLIALEEALGVEVSEQTRLLRELMCTGERIRSHATHLYFLALPDYIGFESAMAMAPEHGDEIKKALHLIKLGNNIVSTVSCRDIHPVAAVVGGFTKTPTKEELNSLLRRLLEDKEKVVEAARFFCKLKYPEFERKTNYFALDDGRTYAMVSGDNVSCTGGVCMPKSSYIKHLREYLKPYSTAKFVVSGEEGYLVGALARVNNNRKHLSIDARRIIDESGVNTPSNNPFHNNLCQAVEMIHHIDRAIEILQNIPLKEDEPPVEVKIKAGHGLSAVEAPRGLLFHDYDLNDDGAISKVNIITPTSQNLRNIEEDIKAYLPGILDESEHDIIIELEKLIRSYDPCISCSTHFLRVKWL